MEHILEYQNSQRNLYECIYERKTSKQHQLINYNERLSANIFGNAEEKEPNNNKLRNRQ